MRRSRQRRRRLDGEKGEERTKGDAALPPTDNQHRRRRRRRSFCSAMILLRERRREGGRARARRFLVFDLSLSFSFPLSLYVVKTRRRDIKKNVLSHRERGEEAIERMKAKRFGPIAKNTILIDSTVWLACPVLSTSRHEKMYHFQNNDACLK